MSQTADAPTGVRSDPDALFRQSFRGKTMTLSRMAVLGAVVSTTALLAGQGLAQISPPTVTALTPKPAVLEAIHGSTIDCESTGVLFTPSGGYGGSADVFDGQAALILKGSKLDEVTSVAVVTADGRRLTPTSQSQCQSSAGVSLRVVFDLPTVARPGSRATLEVMAKEPARLVVAVPPGATPQKTCVDRLTGAPTACPELPTATPGNPGQVKIATVQLMLFPRAKLESVTPDSVPRGGRTVCPAVLTFRGSKMGSLKITPDSSAINAGMTLSETSRSDSTVVANSSKPCASGIVSSSVVGLMTVRRGASARPTDLHNCDTCAGPSRSGPSFGIVGVTYGRG